MSLVERVTRAFLGFEHLPDDKWSKHWIGIQRTNITPPKARAAIREVAAWMLSIGHDKAIVSDLLKQLEETK